MLLLFIIILALRSSKINRGGAIINCTIIIVLAKHRILEIMDYLEASIMKRLFFIVAVCVFVATPALADMVYWADWTSAGSSTATGSIALPGETISVDFSGTIAFSQTTGGTDWWAGGNPTAAYTSAEVENAPSPTNDIISLNAASINTLTFSTAVINPVMAILSQGQPNLAVTYAFDQPFAVRSEGPGWWGDGWYIHSGNDLTGYEFHGVIQFLGTYDTISWTNSPNEYWHGFTVAAPAVVPVPGAVLLGILGLGAAGLKLRKHT